MNVFNLWQFALFSANLHRYLPDIPWERHQGLYDTWRDYHQERPLSHQLGHKHIDGEVIRACQEPTIISLFHLGDHLVWPVLLAQNGICFNVLLDRAVYENARAVFGQLLHQLSQYGHTPELLFSDDPALLLKIRSRKTLGQHLLCFADGASGSNMGNKDERVSVPFLEGKVWLKKGIPFIGHLFGMPVVSLVPRAVETEQCLQVDTIVAPLGAEDRDAYIPRCLQKNYSGLEKTIRNSPYMWECWGYLHRNGMLGKIDDIQSIGDREALVQLPWKDGTVWFDRTNYTASLM